MIMMILKMTMMIISFSLDIEQESQLWHVLKALVIHKGLGISYKQRNSPNLNYFVLFLVNP